MSGVEWAGITKLVIEVAGKLQDALARQRGHTASFSALIDLHEKLKSLQRATDDLLANRSIPILPRSEIFAQEKWLNSCVAFFRTLMRVDRAIIRVYSPGLASYLDCYLPRREYGFMEHEMRANPHRWSGQLGEVGKLYAEIETFKLELFPEMRAPEDRVKAGQYNQPIDLRMVSSAAQAAAMQLHEFIKQHWTSPRV
jgi:hypothetical protein